MLGLHQKKVAPSLDQAKRRNPRRQRNKMKSVYVGNLNFETTEADLRTLFEPFGEVQSISVINDRETGRPRGFAFVEMPDDYEAAKAVAGLNGREVGGRALRINEAAPRLERSRPRGNFSGPGTR
jgi:cold-inducible RNA-binding protein